MLSVRVWATQPDAQFLISRAAVNRNYIPEGDQQISLMRSLYSKAERVIGWLGPDENGGGQALKALESLLGNMLRYPNIFEWVRRLSELLTMNEIFTTDSGMRFQSNDMLEKMVFLFKRPFWA